MDGPLLSNADAIENIDAIEKLWFITRKLPVMRQTTFINIQNAKMNM